MPLNPPMTCLPVLTGRISLNAKRERRPAPPAPAAERASPRFGNNGGGGGGGDEGNMGDDGYLGTDGTDGFNTELAYAGVYKNGTDSSLDTLDVFEEYPGLLKGLYSEDAYDDVYFSADGYFSDDIRLTYDSDAGEYP